MPVVGAVGTTHPYAVTGLALELVVAASLGVRPVTVIAGVSAQAPTYVLARTPLDPATIAAQFAALADVAVDAWSVGALLDPSSVRAVAGQLRDRANVVCDPVIATSDGDRLADDATIVALRDLLLPVCTLVAPNLAEASLLTGRAVRTLADVPAAIGTFHALGARHVLVTGGHLDGDPCDCYSDGTAIVELCAPRIDATLRGTGTLLCAAIAARLAHGDPPRTAVEAARAFVRERIAHGVPFAGMRVTAERR